MPHEGSRCTTCGEFVTSTVREHYRKVHQEQCTVQYSSGNGREREKLKRAEDGLWYCRKCGASFSGTPRGIQRHALHDRCQDDTNMEVHDEEDDEDEDEDEDGESDDEQPRDSDEPEPETEIDERAMHVAEKEAEVQVGPSHVANNADRNDEDVEMKVEVVTRAPEIEIIDLTRFDTPMVDGPLVEAARESSVKRSSYPLQKQRSHPYARAEAAPSFSAVKQEWHAVATVDNKPSRWAQLQALSQARRQGATVVIPKNEPGPSTFRNTANKQAASSATVSPVATSSSSVVAAPSSSEPPPTRTLIPLALRTFLEALGEPPEELAPIFIRHGFITERRIDALAEVPPEGHWDVLKQEIIGLSDLARWLVIEAGLEERVRTRSLRKRI